MAVCFEPGDVERHAIASETQIVLRRVQPRDAEPLLRAFEKLSPESRYRRFFGHKNALSADEVRSLTDLDGTDHFAIGAVVEGAGGSEEGVGVARFIRHRHDPRTAEAAVTVIDAFQKRGIGSLLAGRLLAAAAERGVDRLEFAVLAENQPMMVLLRKLALAAGARAESRSGGIAVTVVLPTAPFGRARPARTPGPTLRS